MEEFAGNLRGGRGIRGWMRGWVEGRSLVNLSSDEHVKELMREQDELMSRPDVTAAFILASSVAVLASAQVRLDCLPSKLRVLTLYDRKHLDRRLCYPSAPLTSLVMASSVL